MKKLLFFALALVFLATAAQAKTLRMALDADPESMDPHVRSEEHTSELQSR